MKQLNAKQVNGLTKKEVTKVVKDVMTGADCMTHVVFGKKDGKWFVETFLNRMSISEWSDYEWIQTEQYSCNGLTNNDIKEIMDDDFRKVYSS